MNIDDKITESLEEASRGAQRRPGAWEDIDRRIGLRHRRRVITGALAVAVVVAAGVLIVPRISSNEANPPVVARPVETAGWSEFRSPLDGYRVIHPKTWSAKRESGTDVASIVPNDVARSGGKPLFSLDLVVNSANYRDALIYRRKAPEYKVSEGTLPGGYPYVRVEHSVPNGNLSVTYHIDWTTPLCPPGARCPRPIQGSSLDARLSAATPSTWSRYGATAEQIVRSTRAIPSQRPARVATVVAKLPVAAANLAVGSDAIWALQRSEVTGHAGKLIRINPMTNRVVASIDVGVSPTAVTASENGVWVANGPLDGYAAPYPAQDSVMRIDPSTNKVVATIRVRHPQDVAVGRADILWVTAAESDSNDTLISIDPQTNKIYERIALPGTTEFAHISVGEGPPSDRRDVVWVTTVPASTGGPDRTFLNRIDTDRRLRTIEIQAGGISAPLIAGLESVWVGIPGKIGANALARIDVATNRVVATIELPDGAPIGVGSVATGEGYVWPVGGRGALWRVDPTTNGRVGDALFLGEDPPVGAGEIVYGFGSLWVPTGDGKIWRLEP